MSRTTKVRPAANDSPTRRTDAFLEPAAGRPRLNVLDMACEGMHHDPAAVLRQAAAQDTEVTREGVRIRNNGDFSYVNLSVTKIHEPESVRGLLLVTFRPRLAAMKMAKAKGRAHSRGKGRGTRTRLTEHTGIVANDDRSRARLRLVAPRNDRSTIPNDRAQVAQENRRRRARLMPRRSDWPRYRMPVRNQGRPRTTGHVHAENVDR